MPFLPAILVCADLHSSPCRAGIVIKAMPADRVEMCAEYSRRKLVRLHNGDVVFV